MGRHSQRQEVVDIHKESTLADPCFLHQYPVTGRQRQRFRNYHTITYLVHYLPA